MREREGGKENRARYRSEEIRSYIRWRKAASVKSSKRKGDKKRENEENMRERRELYAKEVELW